MFTIFTKKISRKFSLLEINPRLVTFLCISLVTFFIGFTSFIFTFLSDTRIARAETKSQSQNNIASLSKTKNKSILEVHIASTGMIFIQNAKVVSIDETNIMVSTSWNSLNLIWKIQTNELYYGKRHFGTSFLDSKGKILSINDIKIGNSITISGDLDTNSIEPIVKADVIRTSY